MSEEHIKCPSGLAVGVRGLKAKEANLLGDPKAIRAGTLFDTLLSNCCLGVDDPGPYNFPSGAIEWSRVLAGDRLYALLRIRIATYPLPYVFTVPCQGEACREAIEWEIDLNDLPVKPLPDSSRAAITSGERLHVSVDGKRYGFHLPTGADEKRAQTLLRQQRERLMTASLMMRVDEIEGVKPEDRLRFLEDLDLGATSRLIEALDAADCGIDTDIEIECSTCGLRQEVRLPFGKEFFLPKTRKTT
jgi:hypothetical protein